MMLDKKVAWSAIIVVLLVGFLGGCAPVSEQKVEQKIDPVADIFQGQPEIVALKFAVGDSTTYKVVNDFEKSAKYEGSLADDPGFKGGSAVAKIDLTFHQQIDSVDDLGNAVAKITVKSLKYLYISKGLTTIDFDSADANKNKDPLSRLIGQSYTIQLSPSGNFLKLVDAKDALVAVSGSKVAMNLLTKKAVEFRHGTMVLPTADKSKLRKGESWSSSKDFSFGLMGSKSYERVYELKGIRNKAGHRIALIEMETMPNPDTKTFQDQQSEPYSKLFDNTEAYTGHLELDLTAGKIEKYSEQMKSEWVVIDSSKCEENPDMVIMTAIRFYSIKKVD